MAFGNAETIRADVEFRANTAAFSGDMQLIRAQAERTFGALDATTLKAALASEKYDRALARSKGSSFAVAKATAAYKAELASLEGTEARATAGSVRHSNALHQEERNLGGMARGALAGSGALGHLGRAAVFASSSVLGGYGLIYALHSVVGAARNSEVALGHLETAVDNSGLSWQANSARIRKALADQVAATGFAERDLTETLATNVRRFGDINQALRANAIEADVARAKNISLADAQSLVQRASFGNAKTLRTLGIEVTKTTTNMDALKAATRHASAEQIAAAKAADQHASELNALDAVQTKYHGNNANFLTKDAGKQSIFNAELERSKEIIGGALLPELDRLFVSGAKYLDHLNRTNKLQHDVNEAVHTGGQVVHGLSDTFHLVAPPIRTVNGLLGGTRHSVEVLAEAFVGLKLARFARDMGIFQTATRTAGRAAVVSAAEYNGLAAAETNVGRSAVVSRIALYTGAVAGTGEAAGTSATKVGRLRGSLIGLNAISIAPIVVPIVIDVAQRVNGKVEGFLGKDLGKAYDIAQFFGSGGAIGTNPVAAAYDAIFGSHHTKAAQPKPHSGRGFRDANLNGPGAHGRGSNRGSPSLILGLSYAEQNKLLVAEGTASTADDVAVLNEQIATLDKAINQKGLTPAQLNSLLSERNGLQSQLQSLQQASASSASAAARKADAARRKQLLALTKIPASLIVREAHAESSHASTAAILKLLDEEKAALRRQERQLHAQHAPAEIDALVARQEESVQKHIDRVIKTARKKRIGALESVPVELRLAEATAKAHNASEERLLEIYKKEHAALEKQIATLRKIGASKAEILRARQNEAAVQAKINASQKKATGDFAALEREFLAGIQNLGQYRGNVFGGAASPSIGTFEQHIHWPNEPTGDGHQEATYARRSALAAFDG